MSTDVTSKGFMAPLMTPITDSEVREDFNEDQYDKDSNIRINYEGTIIYSEESADTYGITFSDAKQTGDSSSFIKACADAGHPIKESHIKGYVCTWYNGSDSDMNMMTLEEFMK